MSSTKRAAAGTTSNWSALEAAQAQQSAERSAFLAGAEGRAFVAALERKDSVEGERRVQLAHPLRNVLEQRAVLQTLDAELSDIDRLIAIKDPSPERAAAGRGGAASTVKKHSTSGKRNGLDPVLDRVCAEHPGDAHAAWNALVWLAKSATPPPPITGFVLHAVTYAGGNPLKKEDFLKRFARRVKRRAAEHC